MKSLAFLNVFIVVSFLASGQDGQHTGDTDGSIPTTFIHIAKEHRFMINLHAAYAGGMGSTFKFYPDDISTIQVAYIASTLASKQVTYSNPTKGLGDGIKFGFGASYIVNDFINLGLDFDYFNSTIRKYRDSSFRQTRAIAGNGADERTYSEKNKISYEATLLSFTPNITFKAIARPKWFLYNKLGAIITFRPNSLQEDVSDVHTSMGWQGFFKDSSSRSVKKYDWSIRNPAFGFMGAFGGQFKLAQRVRVYAEAQFSHIVFVIRKRTLTDYTVDNQQLKENLPTSMRELEFVRSFSSTGVDNDPNAPSQTILQRIPITYLSLQVGLAYQL